MQIQDRKRLVADYGKLLTNGNVKAKVVDISVEDVENWTEIDDPTLIIQHQ